MGNLHGRMPTKGFLTGAQITNKDGSQITSPTTTYELSDFDTAGDPIYIGNLRADGAWVIEQYNVANGTTRYVSGLDSYSTAWTNRASQTYDYYSEVF